MADATVPEPDPSFAAGRQRSGRDLLAATVADIAALIGSRTRALALRRFLVERTPADVPARVSGVAQQAWNVVRADAFLPAYREISRVDSEDGTVKLALRLGDAIVETVLISSHGRGTVCVSSQAGCTRRCDFCATPRLGAGRNLGPARSSCSTWPPPSRSPSARRATSCSWGWGSRSTTSTPFSGRSAASRTSYPGLSSRHVTVSTAGVLPGMKRFLAECDANLALSLNATTDDVRTRLMPHNARWPIAALLGLLREEGARQPGRRFFIEYVLLAGVNDTPGDARRLADLLRGIAAQVNVIPHNAFAGSPYAAPSREATLQLPGPAEVARGQVDRALAPWRRNGRRLRAARAPRRAFLSAAVDSF